MRSFQRLKRGQLFRLNEPTANAVLAAAENFERHRMDPEDTGPPEYHYEGTIIQVRNDSGQDLRASAWRASMGP